MVDKKGSQIESSNLFSGSSLFIQTSKGGSENLFNKTASLFNLTDDKEKSGKQTLDLSHMGFFSQNLNNQPIKGDISQSSSLFLNQDIKPSNSYFSQMGINKNNNSTENSKEIKEEGLAYQCKTSKSMSPQVPLEKGETQAISEDESNMPISNAKFDINYNNEDLINAEVYCKKISKMINEWKNDLDDKYTFYFPYKQQIVLNSTKLDYLKDSANTTSKLFNTIQSHIQHSLSSLASISNEQKILIAQLKQIDEELNQYNTDAMPIMNYQPNPKDEIKTIYSQLTASLSTTATKIEEIKKKSFQYRSGNSKQCLKQINNPLFSSKSNDVKLYKQSVKDIINTVYKEIQSIQLMEQEIAFKLHSL